jgi:hypothetical protein
VIEEEEPTKGKKKRSKSVVVDAEEEVPLKVNRKSSKKSEKATANVQEEDMVLDNEDDEPTPVPAPPAKDKFVFQPLTKVPQPEIITTNSSSATTKNNATTAAGNKSPLSSLEKVFLAAAKQKEVTKKRKLQTIPEEGNPTTVAPLSPINNILKKKNSAPVPTLANNGKTSKQLQSFKKDFAATFKSTGLFSIPRLKTFNKENEAPL